MLAAYLAARKYVLGSTRRRWGHAVYRRKSRRGTQSSDEILSQVRSCYWPLRTRLVLYAGLASIDADEKLNSVAAADRRRDDAKLVVVIS